MKGVVFLIHFEEHEDPIKGCHKEGQGPG
jgi:hypothetical protein